MRDMESLFDSIDKTQEQAQASMQHIFSAAHASAVYAEPVQAGEYTVITASEVAAGGGFGFGRGLGPAPDRDRGSPADGAGLTGGGGAGGGGGSTARPVAVIIVGPGGVKVQPIVDVTKIALAALTAWGVMVPTLIRISRGSKKI